MSTLFNQTKDNDVYWGFKIDAGNFPSLRDYFIRHPFCETEPLRISEAFSMCGIIGQCVPE